MFLKDRRLPKKFFMAGMFPAPAQPQPQAHMKGRPSSCLDPGHPALVLTGPEHLTQDDQVHVSRNYDTDTAPEMTRSMSLGLGTITLRGLAPKVHHSKPMVLRSRNQQPHRRS